MRKLIIASATVLLSTPAFAVYSFKGSDTLAGVMTDAIVAAGLEGEISYVGGGSGKGEEGIVAGTQGIAAMSRAMKPELVKKAAAAGTEMIEHTIGLDGLGLFVKGDSPVAKLDMAMLKKIFTCEVTTWEQVPASGKTGTIKALRRNDASGTTDTFKSLVGVKEFGACVTIMAETSDIAAATARDADALGYAGMSAKRDGNKAVAIAKTAGGAVYLPTVNNIRSFIYPLARKLYVYEAKGAVNPNGAESKLLDKVVDRSFLDPIIQQNEFYTLD